MDVFKTTAGQLPCKSIVHIVAPHTTQKLSDVVRQTLQLADQDESRSIAFPALGTGIIHIIRYCNYYTSMEEWFK